MPTAVLDRPDWDVRTLLEANDRPPIEEGSGGRHRYSPSREPSRVLVTLRWLRNAIRGALR